MGVCVTAGAQISPLPLIATVRAQAHLLSFFLSHTQMGVSFPATFSSHFNSKAKLGRRAASHSQFSPGEKKGDSLDVARERKKLVVGWGVVANVLRAQEKTTKPPQPSS